MTGPSVNSTVQLILSAEPEFLVEIEVVANVNSLASVTADSKYYYSISLLPRRPASSTTRARVALSAHPVVAVRPDEAPLTGPIAGAQRWRRELVFMPKGRHAQTPPELVEAIGEIASFGWIITEEAAQPGSGWLPR